MRTDASGRLGTAVAAEMMGVRDGKRVRRARAAPWARSLPTRQRVGRTVAAIVAAVSAFLAVVALAVAVESFWRTNGWVETTGTVVELHGGFNDGTTIRFADSDGIEYTVRADSREPETRVGDRVTVKYPPRDPDRALTSAEITDERVGLFIIFPIFGVVATYLTLWSIGFVGRRRHPKDAATMDEAAVAVRLHTGEDVGDSGSSRTP